MKRNQKRKPYKQPNLNQKIEDERRKAMQIQRYAGFVDRHEKNTVRKIKSGS